MAKTQNAQPEQPLAPAGQQAASQTPLRAETPVIDTAPAAPEAVSETFEGLKPAEGNVLIRNVETGTVAELNEADARRLVAESPKQFSLV